MTGSAVFVRDRFQHQLTRRKTRLYIREFAVEPPGATRWLIWHVVPVADQAVGGELLLTFYTHYDYSDVCLYTRAHRWSAGN
jgi:hypothetical protein